MALDTKAYNREKTTLPYICCGNFNPPYRRIENFGSINHFILDIDHISQKESTLESMKEMLKSDPHILLMFASPSNDGLKIFFRLSEKCYDAGKYSLFYKAFVRAFARKYNLMQVIDKSTSDVTRACFISYDKDAYFNAAAKPVVIKDYINFENLAEVREIETKIKEEEKIQKKQQPKENQKNTITPDILDEIKKKLNPNIRTKKEKIIYVPDEVEAQVENVKQYMQQNNIKTKEVRNIHFGKKFVFEIEDKRWAEINLFYGKKGYSVVITAKSGSNAELAEVCHKLMCEIFY
ncbi:MAG: CRISPR-associated primase-polymerase type B [Bacteroidales bacterium]|nr:CRISPR-associated primase-polymerase type B [Bacteroidales bacterium]